MTTVCYSSFTSAVKSSKSRFAILGLLARAPATGYDIRKLVEQTLSHFWSESYGQIYPILNQLARQGSASRKTQRQQGKPDRRVYSITPKGREELRRWLSEPPEFQVERNETLLKLFFGVDSDPEETLRHIERYRDHHLQLLELYNDIDKKLEEDDEISPEERTRLQLTLAHGKAESRALLRWCDVTLDTIAEEQQSHRRKSRRRG
jgi:PadR family transcriptional regulator AphA